MAKLWISFDEQRVLIGHNKGGVPESTLHKIIGNVVKSREKLLKKWADAVAPDEYAFIDQDGYLEKYEYYPPLTED